MKLQLVHPCHLQPCSCPPLALLRHSLTLHVLGERRLPVPPAIPGDVQKKVAAASCNIEVALVDGKPVVAAIIVPDVKPNSAPLQLVGWPGLVAAISIRLVEHDLKAPQSGGNIPGASPDLGSIAPVPCPGASDVHAVSGILGHDDAESLLASAVPRPSGLSVDPNVSTGVGCLLATVVIVPLNTPFAGTAVSVNQDKRCQAHAGATCERAHGAVEECRHLRLCAIRPHEYALCGAVVDGGWCCPLINKGAHSLPLHHVIRHPGPREPQVLAAIHSILRCCIHQPRIV
mmetsp:Transcript_7053/g.18231  ORF Transcript_7053/g.18231 Transcript_7053/m.18231 type:complete len:288 (+) Transcript_7053:5418-6281(+)